MQYSVAVRNAQADAFETVVGTSPVMKIFDGTMPANCAAADAGTVLATLTLPADWLSAASNGSKSKSGTWEDASADATGVCKYFRLYSGATCHQQGTITAIGLGGDMEVNNLSLAAGQTFTVVSYTISRGNA